MKSVSKLKHQVKSSKYYLFWGAATIAVMAGQIYVGNGYRQMSESMDGISADINLLDRGFLHMYHNQEVVMSL